MSAAEEPAARRSRQGLAAMMLGSGVLHLVAPGAYERIVPGGWATAAGWST
jgi:uncharacterized membrane protein